MKLCTMLEQHGHLHISALRFSVHLKFLLRGSGQASSKQILSTRGQATYSYKS